MFTGDFDTPEPKAGENPGQPVPNNGGQGVNLDPHHKRSDIRMLVRAAVQGWLTPSQIAAAGRTLAGVMADDGADPRARVAAAKSVVEIAKLAQQVGEFDAKVSGEVVDRVVIERLPDEAIARFLGMDE